MIQDGDVPIPGTGRIVETVHNLFVIRGFPSLLLHVYVMDFKIYFYKYVSYIFILHVHIYLNMHMHDSYCRPTYLYTYIMY